MGSSWIQEDFKLTEAESCQVSASVQLKNLRETQKSYAWPDEPDGP